MSDPSSRPAIAVVGAAGHMTSTMVHALMRSRPDLSLRLLDRDDQALRRTYPAAPPSATLAQVDLNDTAGLEKAVGDSRFLIHGAGPFHKTAEPIRRFCIERGLDYFDIDDDVESTIGARDLDKEATARGVALYVGHGASPGFTNLLAVDLIRRLDEAHAVEVAWTVGDEGRQEVGRAVAEHTMHIGAGPCLTWRDGHAVTRETFASSTVFPMGGVLGDYRLYECAHPEPITIPWTFPGLREVTCWGGLHPQPLNGLLRGVALAVQEGRMTLDQGCGFLLSIMADRFGSLAGWRAGLSGVAAQHRRGEVSGAAVRAFLWDAVRNAHGPTRSGMAARVRGVRGGRRVTLVRQSSPIQSGTFMDTMANMTGLSAAAFLLMILDGPRRTGFQPPERWADGDRFFSLAAQLSPKPIAAVVGPVLEILDDAPA